MGVADTPQNFGKCFFGSFKASENFGADLGRALLLRMQIGVRKLIFGGKPTKDTQNLAVAGFVRPIGV